MSQEFYWTGNIFTRSVSKIKKKPPPLFLGSISINGVFFASERGRPSICDVIEG